MFTCVYTYRYIPACRCISIYLYIYRDGARDGERWRERERGERVTGPYAEGRDRESEREV